MNQALEDDVDPWAQTGRTSTTDGADDAFTSPGVDNEDVLDVVDAAATEVPPRKKSVGPKIVIGLVALVVVGIAGSGMYNLYRKIVPAPEVAATEDRRETPADAAPPSDGASTAGLPGMPQPAGAATTIGATTATAPIASVDPAAFAAAASAPAAVAPAAPAIAPAVAVPASAAVVPPPAVPTVTVPAAPAVAATPGPKPVESAAVPPEKAAQKPASPAVAAKPEQVTKAATKKEKRHAAAAHKQRGSKPDAAVAGDRPVRKIATRTSKVGVARRATKASGTAVATEQIGTGALTRYRIESIEPRFGEHQNAWIRSRDGRLHVVAKGDSLEGARVIKVDGADYQVQTTQGVIR